VGFEREVGFSHMAYFGPLNDMEGQDLLIPETGIPLEWIKLIKALLNPCSSILIE
jgi:hypothetical protein